jgi:hypothetical protein
MSIKKGDLYFQVDSEAQHDRDYWRVLDIVGDDVRTNAYKTHDGK